MSICERRQENHSLNENKALFAQSQNKGRQSSNSCSQGYCGGGNFNPNGQLYSISLQLGSTAYFLRHLERTSWTNTTMYSTAESQCSKGHGFTQSHYTWAQQPTS